MKGDIIMTNQELNEGNSSQGDELKKFEEANLAKKLDVIGWGLFFIWIGIAFLANIPFEIGLLGVGIITLGVQVVRKSFNLNLEGFWIVVGLLFILGGLWELFKIEFQLVPILIILAGLVMIISIISGKRQTK